MSIVLKSVKGTPLTHSEMDNNFDELDKIPNGKIFPSSQTIGIKLDIDSPVWGWHDIPGTLRVADSGSPAQWAVYRSNIRAVQFDESEEAFVDFHMPHDYAQGTDIFIHAHWSHTSTVITGGSVTWGFELMYAKGHGQAAFPAPVTPTVLQTANTTQYWHHVAEVQASVTGGSSTAITLEDLEVDGLIQCRIYLDSNDIITSDLSTVAPFVHFVDIHYQSTGLPTKNRAPDFWS